MVSYLQDLNGENKLNPGFLCWYLDAGESPLSIPGICTQVEREIDPYFDIYYEETPEEVEVEWRPQLLIELVEVSFERPFHYLCPLVSL